MHGRFFGVWSEIRMWILLAGFTPYVTHGLDPDVVYRGT